MTDTELCKRLRDTPSHTPQWAYALVAADEIERLRAERDEARREVCEARAACIQGKKATEIAEALGWSCFQREAQP